MCHHFMVILEEVCDLRIIRIFELCKRPSCAYFHILSVDIYNVKIY